MRRVRADLMAAGWPREDAEAVAIDCINRARGLIRSSWARLADDFPNDTPNRTMHRLMWPTYRRAYRITVARPAP